MWVRYCKKKKNMLKGKKIYERLRRGGRKKRLMEKKNQTSLCWGAVIEEPVR